MAHGNGGTSPGEDASASPDLSAVLRDLISRAQLLQAELREFREHLHVLRKDQHTIIASFRGTVTSELAMLERLFERQDQKSASHIARSSNLPFLETVWTIAKRSHDLTSLQQRVYYESSTKSLSQSLRQVHVGRQTETKRRKNASTTVDAMTDGGRTWIKVSLVTNTRLLFDLAKQGWDSGGSEADEDGISDGRRNGDDDDDDIPLVKTVRELCRAARSYRVRTWQPKVRVMLPRVTRHETPEIDAILDDCASAGALICAGPDATPVPPLSEAMLTMAPDPIAAFSARLNVDCTILLALVSDFSHAKVSKEPWFDPGLKRQVEIEDNENLLPSLLYPALGTHTLVCTQEASKRMREIVATIGTSSEKARTAIMMGDDPTKAPTEYVRELQQWSAYSVPEGLQLPVRIVDQFEDHCQTRLPAEAQTVSAEMTDINRSVFLYGWASGATTLTSNRTVVKQLQSALDRHVDLPDSVWPSIWLCPTARSLVGREKRGTKKDGKPDNAYRLPDPLVRETMRRNGLDVLVMRHGHEVEDLRPNGYPCDEVLEAKNAASRSLQDYS